MWYNIFRIKKYRKENQIVSWEIINTNPEYEMFRLEELENEQNENIYLTEEELELIEEYNKKGYITISGII